MKNDKYVVMYCNELVGSRNTLQGAIELINLCKESKYYYNDEKHEFSIHVKVEV